ncbi:MAG TPA: hypothetical protein VFW59_06175 [Gallionella sp.]|nr:hypothetical protein [Gallionella sp.]
MVVNSVECMPYKLTAIATLVAMLYAPCARSEEPDAPVLVFRGFGSMGVVHSSEGNADFVGNFSQPNGAGFTRSWSTDVDTRIGAQANATINERLSAAVQVVAQHRYDNSYSPQIEWANLKYQFTPEIGVRAGRTLLATFMESDSRLVSYSYPWVRPPQEIYGMLPVTNKDGVDAFYRIQTGEATNTVQASYGDTILKTPGGGEVRGRPIFDINDTLEYGAGTVRIGYTKLRGDVHSPTLDNLFGGLAQFGNTVSAIPGLQATGAQALALVSKYQLIRFPYSVVTVGGSYDPGTWLLMGEWASAKTSAAISSANAWYVTGGYRFGDFMPYLTLAKLKVDKLSEPGIQTAGLPPALAQTALALNSGLNAVINGYALSQQTVSMGLRWDFARSMALKLQYDRLSLGAGSTGWLGNIQPGFQPGGRVNVLSAVADFVF